MDTMAWKFGGTFSHYKRVDDYSENIYGFSNSAAYWADIAIKTKYNYREMDIEDIFRDKVMENAENIRDEKELKASLKPYKEGDSNFDYEIYEEIKGLIKKNYKKRNITRVDIESALEVLYKPEGEMISAVDYIKALKIMAKEEILPDDIVEKIKERVKIREEWEASVVLKEDKLMEEELNEEMNEEKK